MGVTGSVLDLVGLGGLMARRVGQQHLLVLQVVVSSEDSAASVGFGASCRFAICPLDPAIVR